MAEINFRDEQLDAWFNDTYTAANVSAENATAYQNAQDKDAFKREKIAAERKSRFIQYMTNLQIESGRPVTVNQVEAIINGQIQTDIQRASEARGHPVTEDQIVSEYALSEIRRHDAQNQNNQDNHNDTIVEAITQRNFTSDEWQQMINGENTLFLNNESPVRVGMDREILRSMQKLPKDFDNLSPDEQADAINLAKANLNAEERNDFNTRDTQLKQKIIEQYPPNRLVDTDLFLEEAEKNAKDDALKQQIQSSRQAIMNAMVGKINDYAGGQTIVDQTNVADVYDGSMRMYEYVEKKNDHKNKSLDTNIQTCRNKLDIEIKQYDKDNGFTDLTNKDAHEINETYLRAQKQIQESKNINCPPAALNGLWANIQFADESINPKTGKTKREELYDSFNDAVIQKAIMNAAVKHKGKKDKDLEAAIQSEIDQLYTAELGALLTANEAAKHLIAEQSKKQADPNYVPQPLSENEAKARGNAALAAVQSGNGKYVVDNNVLVTNFARYTNSNYGYLNRLGTKIGKKTNVIGHMSESIKKFDNTCIKRFDPYYQIAKTRLQAAASAGNIGRQALNQLARYGSSFIPFGNFVYAGYVGAQAAIRLGIKYSRLKKEAKKNNRQFSSLGFLKDHIGEIGSSIATTTAIAIGGGLLADGLRYGALGVSNLTNLVKTTIRQREKGDSWKKSIGVAAFSVALSAGTAIGTSMALGYGMHEAGLTPSGSHDEPITDNDKINELKQLSPEELEKQGYKFEYCDKDDKGAFQVQDGHDKFYTRDYTKEELDFAQHRMEKVLDPNDSHTGGTRYSEYLGRDWTPKEYADNPDAYNNAIHALDKLAETHKDMNSFIDGEFKSNSDMLLYKLHQANILAPNADAIADNGKPIGEVLSYTDEAGNTTNYQDVYHKLLEGKELTEADAKVIQLVEDHVGGQHENGDDHMGMLKDFDRLGTGGHPDSYQAKANVGYEMHEHPGENELWARILQPVEDPRDILPFTMVHDSQGENRALAERVGANAKVKIDDVRRKIPNPNNPPHHVDPKPNPVIPQPVEKLAIFEYQILRGKDPQTTDDPANPAKHSAYQQWVAYCAQVEKERKTAERVENKQIPMDAFLTRRRKKFEDNLQTRNIFKKKENKERLDDFNAHSARPYESKFCKGLYESIERSNKKTPFQSFEQITHYAGEFARDTQFVGLGTRDVSKMTAQEQTDAQTFLGAYQSQSRVFVGSLDKFYGGEAKTADEYEHQQAMYEKDSSHGWKIKAKEAWEKIKTFASVRQQNHQNSQSNG